MVKFICECGGMIEIVNTGNEWEQTGDIIFRDDFVCNQCSKEFKIIFDFDKIECKTCEQDIHFCQCHGSDVGDDE